MVMLFQVYLKTSRPIFKVTALVYIHSNSVDKFLFPYIQQQLSPVFPRTVIRTGVGWDLQVV